MKDKYFFFFYNQGGFGSIQLWRELDAEEVENIENEHGSLAEAAADDARELTDDLFWICNEGELILMREQINKELPGGLTK